MPESRENITIEEMTAADLPRVLELAGQLGYPETLETLADRFAAIQERADHVLVTARAGGGIVGWMHLWELLPLEAPPAAQLAGIVVDENWRGRGVGRLLVAHAEDWARRRGLDLLTLRSRHDRDAAHAFYRARGFTATKTSVVFEKQVKQGP